VESNILSAHYELSRSGSEWAAAAIGPPASLFPANEYLATSLDLGRTLWAQRSPLQSIYARDLYVREADGAFVKVGPMVPPSGTGGPPAGGYPGMPTQYEFAGASRDLSHVLLAIGNRFGAVLWPGDTTEESPSNKNGGTSLYEYVGTGNKQPELVGVSDGRTVVNGKTLPAGTLITDCSTSLGSDLSTDTYNAVSADGETVFFTTRGHNVGECEAPMAPEVSELYARLAGIETLAISEPSPSQCTECNTPTTAALGRRPAEFQGASRDGTKVFFVTDQELLPGDTTTNLYEYDFDNASGKKVLRVSTGSPAPKVQGVMRISQDGSHVYFVAQGILAGENAEHKAPVEGHDNLYVFERDTANPGGRITYIGSLSQEDQADWRVVDERPVQATPDGRFLVFQSAADLTPGDTSTKPQIFEYDALEERLVRVSVGQAGYASGLASADANASSFEPQTYGAHQSDPATAGTLLAVSTDGSHVIFQSVAALTPGAEVAAAAGAASVYEYRSTGVIAHGDVYLISNGTNTLDGRAYGLDASGSDVYFTTVDPLLAQDVDTQFDIYDARTGGGFPAAAVAAGCEGETCRGTQSAQPSLGAPGGSFFVPGGANVLSPASSTVVKLMVKPLTRAQRLAKALAACRHKPKKKRPACEKRARRSYRPARKAKKSQRGVSK
jgi:hypothetical protein